MTISLVRVRFATSWNSSRSVGRSEPANVATTGSIGAMLDSRHSLPEIRASGVTRRRRRLLVPTQQDSCDRPNKQHRATPTSSETRLR
jgi:hypothetical protein